MNLPLIQRDRLIQTLLDLVQIDSPSRHEEPAAAYVRQTLRAAGYESADDALHNVYLKIPGRGAPQPALLVNAHTDTVQPTPNIQIQIDGDILRTDGTTILGADDKAGVAAILEVVRLLKESDLPHAPLDVVFTVQEEVGLNGAAGMRYDWLEATMGVCLDVNGPPSRLTLAAPGQNNIEAIFHGQSAHAGVAPERGKNAIVAASRAIAAMPLGRLDAETTANVGIIRGGQARNIVADRCEIIAEARSRDDTKLRKQTEAMVAALQQTADESGCRLELTVKSSYTAYRHEPTAPIVQRCVAALRALGNEPTFGETGGGSDANVFNQHGISTVLIGVDYQDIHTPQEHVALAAVEELARTLLAIAVGPAVG